MPDPADVESFAAELDPEVAAILGSMAIAADS